MRGGLGHAGGGRENRAPVIFQGFKPDRDIAGVIRAGLRREVKLGTDGGEDIGPFRALVAGRAGACAAPGPTIAERVLLPDPRLVPRVKPQGRL